jgi:hypothetical protein
VIRQFYRSPVSGLPSAPDNYQYVLSLVRDGVQEAVANFQVNEAGMVKVDFELPNNIVQYESATVSLEPTGERPGHRRPGNFLNHRDKQAKGATWGTIQFTP